MIADIITDTLHHVLTAPVHLTVLACLLLAVQVVSNAFDQAHIWARGGSPDSSLLERVQPHAVDEVQELGYYAMALLIGNPVAVLGTGFAVRPVFEGIINVGVGRDFWDQGAEERDFVVRVLGQELYRRPKVNSKPGLIVQAVFGAALIASTPFVTPLLLSLL